ncbi:hypothetical protein CR513_43328, partial [Mucuna pruriens]
MTFAISSNYLKIFKTKKDSKDNIKRYKVRLVAKVFTQKKGIDYKETFSLISSKDSFRIVMTLVAHFDLELHQMDVKTAFLNDDIDETIYKMQPENFVSNKSKSMVCKLKKSIYGLKQASLITSYGFKANVVDDCVYHKFSGSKYIFLVLYIDHILLASSDTNLLHETKRFLTKNFEMKDLGEASFVLGIQILRDRSQCILKLRESNVRSSLYSFRHCFCGGSFGQHWKAVKRVMHYLKRTKGYLLTYQKSEGCQDSKRSTSRYIYMLVGGAISWKFVKQTLIAPSTIAVGFVACFKASNQRTSFMLVDPLTKGLIPKVFHEHIAHMEIKLMRETKILEDTKVVWLRKTTNQRLAITEDSAAIS